MVTKGKAQVDRYLKLVRALPLRPIRSEADLDRAMAMIDALSDRSRLTADERDYWTVLTRLIEDYERPTRSMRISTRGPRTGRSVVSPPPPSCHAASAKPPARRLRLDSFLLPNVFISLR
jgi:hypothetical protein